jgi:hypothetical protein
LLQRRSRITGAPEKEEANPSTENIFRITDELVHQVDKTKKIIIIMILALVVAIPVSWHLAPAISSSQHAFVLVGYITIALAAIFLGIGVRQWLVLSRWTRKYKKYKELQKKVDDKLDFEENGAGSKE